MRSLGNRNQKPGIALFVVLTSLVILTFTMRELIQSTNIQVERVRNSYDRIQALYLARSTQQLARFFVVFDSYLDKNLGGEPVDGPNDIWAQPIPFPVPIEMINSLTAAQGDASETTEITREQQARFDRCGEFFDDFPGEALAEVSDLSAKINLNDASSEVIQQILLNLMAPNYDFVDALSQRDIRPEEVVQQIRDYIDRNNAEDSSNAPETYPYTNAELDYGPKNRPFSVIEELKLIPSIDDELFTYLSAYVSAVDFPGRKGPDKINLNTVEQDVFQALLSGVNDPQQVAEAFVSDRSENSRLYTAQNLKQQLADFGLDEETLPIQILGGQSNVFRIKTSAQVGEVEIELESFLRKPQDSRNPKPFSLMRLSP